MRLIATLLSFLALASPFVSAATQTDFDTIGVPSPVQTDFVGQSITLDTFDPSLGTLNSITLTITGDISSTVTIFNSNGVPKDSEGTSTVTIKIKSNLKALNQVDNVVTISATSQTVTVPANGQTDVGPFVTSGASGAIGPIVFSSSHGLPVFVSALGSKDPGFAGLDQITLPVTTSSFVGATGGTGLTSGGNTFVSLQGDIVYTYTATITGDPQFAGFQGQQFQFHGLPDTVFNLVSSPELQMNSQFVYIASGVCNYNNTACFSHAGTYLGQIGVAIGSQTFTIVSGPHSKGLSAYVQTGSDRHAMVVGAKFSFTTQHGEMSISHPDNSHVEIRSPNFLFNIINSDSFFNMEASLLNTQLLHVGSKRHNIKHCKDTVATEASLMKHYPVKNYIHGLVGQTWRAVSFCDQPFQGVVGDYIASDLHSNDYRYNYFNATE